MIDRKSLIEGGDALRLFHPRFNSEAILSEIRECLDIGWTGAGFKTVEIERQWCDYTGLPHAFFLNSGTAALHTAVAVLKRAHDWADGDEVILPAMTFVSAAHAVRCERLRVVFADIDRFLCLDPDDLELRITDRTRAVILKGHGGTTGQLAAVSQLCRRRGLALILDAAHLAGAKLDGRDPGHQAEFSCTSFHSVKNLPTFDAGMLSCHSERFGDAIRRFSWLGIESSTYARVQAGRYSWDYDVPELGYKYNGNAIAAAMAIVGLRMLDRDNAHRRGLAAHYETQLREVEGLTLTPIPEDCEPSRHLFQVQVPQRDAMIEALAVEGIHSGVHYRPLHHHTAYAGGAVDLPVTEQVFARLLSLPLHLAMTTDEVERVCAVVARHCRQIGTA